MGIKIPIAGMLFISLVACSTSSNQPPNIIIPATEMIGYNDSRQFDNLSSNYANSSVGNSEVAKLATLSGNNVEIYAINDQTHKVMIIWEEDIAIFNLEYETPHGVIFDANYFDIDNDGEEEIVATILTGTGIGVSITELHVFEKNSDKITDYSFSIEDYKEELNGALMEQTDLRSRMLCIENNSLVIPEGFKIDYLQTTNLIDYILKDETVTAIWGIQFENEALGTLELLSYLKANVSFANSFFTFSDFELIDLSQGFSMK